MPILAPHSSDSAMATVKDTPVIKLTLDQGLQKVLEPLARDRAIALGPNIRSRSLSSTMTAATCWRGSVPLIIRQ